MSLSLSASVSAMGPALQTSVVGLGGVEPYVYSVDPDGAGGTIDADTGFYTSPLVVNPDVAKAYDTLRVTDANNDEATTQILVTDALGLFCEIIQKELGLDSDHIYLWDQKIMQPKDSGLYVAVGIQRCRPFGNTNQPDSSGSGVDAVQSVNMLVTLSVDAISRGLEALRRKEEIIMALASDYSRFQQAANSFNIGTIPPGGQFVNLSHLDGSAIPYRFSISVNMQYFARRVKPVPYFDDFAAPQLNEEP